MVLSQTFFMFIHIILSHRAFVFHPKMLTGVQVRFCWIQLIWMKSFIILTEIWNGLCFIKQCFPPIKLLLQIIIVCPSHWIFRIFLFKHDPQLLLTVPLKKKNSFELLSYYSWRFYQRHIWSYYSNSISRENNSNIFRREVGTWK